MCVTTTTTNNRKARMEAEQSVVNNPVKMSKMMHQLQAELDAKAEKKRAKKEAKKAKKEAKKVRYARVLLSFWIDDVMVNLELLCVTRGCEEFAQTLSEQQQFSCYGQTAAGVQHRET